MFQQLSYFRKIKAKEKKISLLSAQLGDPSTGPKTSWSILNQFLHKKVPKISPILVSGDDVLHFSEKAELFHSHFASQFTPNINNSKLLSLEFKINQSLENITFTGDDISVIIKNVKVDKAHGWDNVSFQMIKLCGKSIALPLRLIFQLILTTGFFQMTGKRVTLFHALKKKVKT